MSDIKRQIEAIPVGQFAELAAWLWQYAEEVGMLRACLEVTDSDSKPASREEIFDLLDRT